MIIEKIIIPCIWLFMFFIMGILVVEFFGPVFKEMEIIKTLL